MKFNEGAYISVKEINVARVAKTYNGKLNIPGVGEYAYTEEAAKTAGYEVKVSPTSIKNTVNKINSALRGEFAVDSLVVGDDFVSIDANGRMYTAYFNA